MSRTDPPGPPNSMFGWNHTAAMSRDLIGFCARLQREYGDVVHFRLGPFPCYQLTHPDHIQDVLVRKARSFRKPTRLKQVFGRFEGNGLVVSDGELWSRQRRLVQPAFQPARLETYVTAIAQCVGQMLDRWGVQAVVDFSAEMRHLALRVVTRTLLSASVDNDVDRLDEAVAAIQQWSMRELNRIVATPSWLPLFGQPKARRAIAFVDRLVRRIIHERQASSGNNEDLLGRLIEVVDSEGDGQGMSDRQLRDEVVTLLLAGHETTAAALTWAGWLLARHGDVQDRIADEVRAILGTRPPEFADLPRLTAVEQAFKEAMRLYPPVYFLSREVAEPVEVAGFEMRPMSHVFLNTYLTQRDPRWFPDPERFDPLRFTPENEQRLPACAWFPLGAGPRACVGRGFAMMEGTIVLASLLQRCRLDLAPGQADPEMEWQLSLHPKGGIRLAMLPFHRSAHGAAPTE